MMKTSTKNAIKKESVPQSQKMVGFGTAVARFWKNYTNFKGIAQRSECFFGFLFVFAVYWIINELDMVMVYKYLSGSLSVHDFGIIMKTEAWIKIIWIAVTFIPGISLLERRFRDAGFAGGWVWLPCLILWLIGTPFSDTASWYFAVFALIASLLPRKLKTNKK